MIRSTARAALLTLLALITAGCGYFNSLYNAQRRFSEAERLEAAGSRAAAMDQYSEAIERAAVSLRSYPDSRWADDALLLIARAHFALNADREAVAALERLLRESTDPAFRTEAHAYLGAARARLGIANSRTSLDSALLSAEDGSDLASFALVWRARARFAEGDTAGAWRDLEAIPFGSTGIRADAALERLARAVATRDSARWQREVQHAVAGKPQRLHADSIRTLVQASADAWGPRFAHAAIPRTAGSAFPEQQRLELAALRAQIVASAGDTTTAIAEALRVGEASALDVSQRARVHAARWQLAMESDPARIAGIRSILVPAFTNAEAVAMIRAIRTLDALIDRADEEPVALFVAAEYARDVLNAPRMARTLFTRFADLPAATAWDAKALLAAVDLAESDEARAETQARLSSMGSDLYVQAVRGGADAAQYAATEQRLRSTSMALLAEAQAIAAAGDISVGRAVAVRDSVRAIIRRDSIVQRCAAIMDSVAVKGIRRDSSSAACLRSDSDRMNAVFRMDTMLLKPKPADTVLVPRPLPAPARR